MALSANGRDGCIRVTRTRHLAAEREMGRVVHLQITPWPILPEVGERGVDQRAVACAGAIVKPLFRQRPRRRTLKKNVGTHQQLAQQILRRLAFDIERNALLTSVVPPVIEAIIRIDSVIHKGAAPAAGTAVDRLDLDHACAAIRQQLPGPLVAAIGKLDHRQTFINPTHALLLSKPGFIGILKTLCKLLPPLGRG